MLSIMEEPARWRRSRSEDIFLVLIDDARGSRRDAHRASFERFEEGDCFAVEFGE